MKSIKVDPKAKKGALRSDASAYAFSTPPSSIKEELANIASEFLKPQPREIDSKQFVKSFKKGKK